MEWIWTCMLILGLQSLPLLTAPANVALNGSATQSSVADVSHPASLVIDGNRHDSSCSSTDSEDDPWWRVDLGKTYPISHINVVQRLHCCPSNELYEAEIRIGHFLQNNGNSNPRCAGIQVSSVVMTFQCNGHLGRYINVYLPGKNKHLHLCEVEVYPASEAIPDPKKKTVLRISTNFDMSDPGTQQQIMSQMKAEMEKKGISDFKIRWRRSFKQETHSKTTECEPGEEDEP